MLKKILIVSAVGLVAAFSTVKAEGIGDDRSAVMKAIGGATAQLAGIAKGEKPYDAAVVKSSLETISAKIKTFPPLFPAGKVEEDGHANPAIWENLDDFKAHADKLGATADSLVAQLPADQAAVGAALGQIGAICGDCHQKYRLKK